jgi:rRNA-processing protein FCF1
MKKVLLDTNFMLVPYQFKLDIFNGIEKAIEAPHSFVIPTGVVNELKVLSKGRGKEGAAARFALKLVKLHKHESVESSGNVDEWILGYATERGIIVATNDRALREKLKRKRVKVLSLRSRSTIGVV